MGLSHDWWLQLWTRSLTFRKQGAGLLVWGSCSLPPAFGEKVNQAHTCTVHANAPAKNIWFKQTQHGVDDSQLFFGQPKISETVAICGTLIGAGVDLFWIQNISKSNASPHAHTQPNPCSIREEIQITRVKEASWLSVCLAVSQGELTPFPRLSSSDGIVKGTSLVALLYYGGIKYQSW